MNALRDLKIRFSTAAYAIDTTPKSLRKWLQSKEDLLISQQSEGEWFNFSFADIACLAIMRKLVDFGLDVDTSNDFARVAVLNGILPAKGFKNVPPDAMQSFFHNRSLAVWKRDGEWFVRVLFPADMTELPDEPAVLLIDLERVVGTAVDRAVEGIET